MKKLLLMLATVCLSTGFSMATEPVDNFNYDEKQISSEFEQLNKIESFVEKNKGVTLEEIKAENAQVLGGVNLSDESAVVVKDASELFGIPAFLWGCVLGVIGILLVYIFTDNDRDQTKKAVIGCLVGSAVGLVIYLVAIAGAVGSSI